MAHYNAGPSSTQGLGFPHCYLRILIKVAALYHLKAVTELSSKLGNWPAEDADTVLPLDEAGSFLQDRTSAHRSWEITQALELLKQVEQFEGLFVCATNLMDRLDPVVLRRFDWKIQFDYLKPDQAGKLFTRVLADLQGYTRPRRSAESVKVRLSQLSTLTPGDFAAVVRRARALETRYDAKQLLGAVEAECQAKGSGGKQVRGFHS